MEQLKSTLRQIRWRIGAWTFVLQCIVIGCILWIFWQFSINPVITFALAILVLLIGAISTAFIASHIVKKPLKMLGEAITYTTAMDNSLVKPSAPNLDDITVGKTYVTNLVFQLYELINNQKNNQQTTHREIATQSSTILSHLPLPLFVLSKDEIITYGSDAGLDYVGISSSDVFGKSIFDVIDMEFSSTFTLGSWLDDCRKNKVTDKIYWRRVRIKIPNDSNIRQCDIAGYYSRDNPKGVEFIITLLDKTIEYDQDDRSLSVVALAVHELRSPLTIMRGYIEAIDDEIRGMQNLESQMYTLRLKASAKQLTEFINNILYVTQIEENQLYINLRETSWQQIIDQVEKDMAVIAESKDKQITFLTDPNLPTINADSSMIYEVLCNLLGNSIKYSGDSKDILVKTSLTKANFIEVQVIDHGVGIPESVVPTLFEKFHRNHRNRSQISGTGLGLYLSKAIINAHGGDIWVRSKEGQNGGTTVGFTLMSYSSNIKGEEIKKRTVNGWIKNHSMLRN